MPREDAVYNNNGNAADDEFDDDDIYNDEGGDYFSFCIQYKSSKNHLQLYIRVSDFGPHTDLIFRGGVTNMWSDLYTSIYGDHY